MRDGFPGHQFDFYRYVRDSSWMGGRDEYSDLTESAPYWFNGIVPLAYGLDDDRLKRQVRQFVEHVIHHQTEDGWLGGEDWPRDLWARFPFVLGLTVWAVPACRAIACLAVFRGDRELTRIV
jgi:hypothetical protein